MTMLDTVLEKVTNTFSQLKYHEKLLDDIGENIADHEKRLCKLESAAELNMSKLKNFIYEEHIKLNTGVDTGVDTLKKQKQLENNL